jgi:hypothetical protein
MVHKASAYSKSMVKTIRKSESEKKGGKEALWLSNPFS